MSNVNTNTTTLTLSSSEQETVDRLSDMFGADYAEEYIVVQREIKRKEIAKQVAKAKRDEKREREIKNGTYVEKWSKRKLAAVKKATVIPYAEFIVKNVTKLIDARVEYEANTLARSKRELYVILAVIYRLFIEAVANNCVKETVALMREQMSKRSVRVQSNTNAITVFVRYVFNSDRKRAYNYASTLMVALQADVSGDLLAEFIESSNGVEECKKQFRKSDAAKSNEAQLAAAKVSVVDSLSAMQAQTVVKLANTKYELEENTQFVFVVARKCADGSLELLHAVNKTTVALQNAAIKQLAKHYVETNGKAMQVAESAINKAASASAAVKYTLNKDAAIAAAQTMRELESA
jgi:hypothetical protein